MHIVRARSSRKDYTPKVTEILPFRGDGGQLGANSDNPSWRSGTLGLALQAFGLGTGDPNSPMTSAKAPGRNKQYGSRGMSEPVS